MRRLWAPLGAGALLVGGVVMAAPASAEPYPYTIEKENTGPASIVAGSDQVAEFTITVSYNSEPQPIEGPAMASFWDTLPYGLVLAEIPAGCTGTVGTSQLECDVDFSEENSAKVVVKATAQDWARPGTYTNCAYLALGASEFDPQQYQVCGSGAPPVEQIDQTVASASVEVTNVADMQLAASQPGQVDPGAGAQITWTASNGGPSGADLPLTLTATLPAGVTWVGGGAAPWECSASGQDVTCTFNPTPPDAPQMICAPVMGAENIGCPVLVVPPGAQIPPVTWNVMTAKPGTVAKYDVTAKVTSLTEDSTPANNSAVSTINVTPVDLAVSKSAGSPVFVGDEATWTVNVGNVGTVDDAGKLTVVDTLPSAATFVAASGDGWTCEAAGQKVTCTRDGLAKGASTDIVVRSKMTSRGDAKNSATVSSQSYEKNTANNSAEKTVKVVRTEQTAAGLPATPTGVKSGKTEQGQKLTTRVRCRPVKASAAGEVSFCKVTRGNGVVRIKVKGSQPMKVTVIQTARGTAKLKPFVQRKTYIVKP